MRVRVQGGRLVFQVRLTPKGGRDAVEGWIGTALKARVRAVPEDGKANAALLALLADVLDVPGSALTLVGGVKARLKTIAVAGDTSALGARLDGLGEAK